MLSKQQQMGLAASVALTASPDHTNGHEQGYQNVRVGQGKPLTSGSAARLLLLLLCADLSTSEQPKMTISRVKRVRERIWRHDSALTVTNSTTNQITLSPFRTVCKGPFLPFAVWIHANARQNFRTNALGLVGSDLQSLSLNYPHQENNYQSN